MAIKRVWDTTDKQYAFFDGVPSMENYMGSFTSLTGGDMTISMIPYTVVGVNDGPTEKYLPGQISYAPIRMSTPMSTVGKELTDWFMLAVEGNYKNLRRNCTIGQYSKFIVPIPTFLVYWHLENAIPIALPGYSYNSYQGTSSTKFKVAIQAEKITIVYP